MAIQLSQLKANTRTIIVPYYGDTVTVTYRPSVLTPARESAIREGVQAGDNAPMLSAIAEMVIEWDVMGEDGEPLARTPQVLETLPSALLSAIFGEIGEDMSPKARKPRNSFGR